MTINKRPPTMFSAVGVAKGSTGAGKAKLGKLAKALAATPAFHGGRGGDADDASTSYTSSTNSSRSALASSAASTSSTVSLAPARVQGAAAAVPRSHVLPPAEALAAVMAALRRTTPQTPETASWQLRAQALFMRHGPTADTLHLLRELGASAAAPAPVRLLSDKLMQQVHRHPDAALGAAIEHLAKASEAQRGLGRPQAAAQLQRQVAALTDLRKTAPADAFLYQEHSVGALAEATALLQDLRGDLAEASRILGNRTLSLSTQAGRLASLRLKSASAGEAAGAMQAALDAAMGHLEQAKGLQEQRRSLSREQEQLRLAQPEQAVARARSIGDLLKTLYRASSAGEDDRCVQALRQSLSTAQLLRASDAVYGKLLHAIDAPTRRTLLQAIDQGTSVIDALEGLPPVPPRAALGGSIGYGRYLQREAQAAQQLAIRSVAAADVLAPVALDIAEQMSALAPTATQRHDNRSGRAFETLLADELIRQMSAPTRAAWQQLGQGAADALAPLDGPRRAAFAGKLHAVLEERGTRPWDPRAPQLAPLKESLSADPSGATLLNLVLEELSTPVGTGYGVLVKAELLRATWASLGEGRLDVSAVQLAQQRFYLDAIGPRARRAVQLEQSQEAANLPSLLTASAAFSAPNVTVMAAHQTKPIVDADLLAAPSAALRYHLDIEDPHVAHFLATGAVVGSGVSGSTNTFMGWLAHLQQNRPDLTATANDVLVGAAAFLIHDAGHSLNEVMWTVAHAPSLAGDQELGLQPALSYQDFQQRFAADPTMQSVIERTFERLAGYTGSLAGQAPAAAPAAPGP